MRTSLHVLLALLVTELNISLKYAFFHHWIKCACCVLFTPPRMRNFRENQITQNTQIWHTVTNYPLQAVCVGWVVFWFIQVQRGNYLKNTRMLYNLLCRTQYFIRNNNKETVDDHCIILTNLCYRHTNIFLYLVNSQLIM